MPGGRISSLLTGDRERVSGGVVTSRWFGCIEGFFMTLSEVRIFISCWLFLLKVLLMIFRFSMVAFSGEVVSFSAMFIFWGKSVLFQARSRRTEGSGGRVAWAVV